jgi:hypothetical protein
MHSSVNTRSSRFVTLALAITLGLGCSGGGSGCSTLTPFAAGTRYSGPKSDNAINLRLSAAGINYLNSNWRSLIDMFAPNQLLTVPVACTSQSFSLSIIGTTTVYIADQGGNPGGRLDGACNGQDLPANVQVKITGFSLTPVAPDKLQATLSLQIATGKIYVLIDSLCNLNCSLDFASTNTGGPLDRNDLAAEIKFTIDSKWDKLLAFNITSLNGTQVCGSSGAPAAPRCIDPADLKFNSEGGGLCSFACDVLDIGAVKDFVFGLLAPTLQSQVQKALDTQRCQACMTNADCPISTDGTNTQSTCDSGTKTCMAAGQCVPRFLGVEGKLNLGATLGAFGAPANAELQLSVAAGATVNVDQGLSFGTRVGIQPTAVSTCVPPQAAPPMTMVAFPDFDGEATPNSGYHVGLGVSSNFLNAAFWSAQQAGALCLNLSSDNVGLVNTGLFKTFLPSLGKLATRDGKDAPMMVVLRPARPPTVVVGKGTYDPVTKKPIKPLLLVTMADVSVDFYAMLDDRQARLFTLTADISLPLSLIFEGCDKVTPALGDLKMLIGNIRTANSEILAEDPQVLADLVPAVIGLAEPALAGALQGFALPSLGSLKLKVNEVKGVGPIAGTEAYNHLGIYATLLPSMAMCAVSSPGIDVAMKQAIMPDAAAMRLDGHHTLPLPKAVLDVRTLGKSGSAEFSYRIDQGLWTEFQPVTDNELVVSHPRFLLQGHHTISVRARIAEDPHALSVTKDIGFLVDWEAPELTLTANLTSNRLEVAAHDVLSADRLTYAYAVGTAARSDFGPAREISLSAVEQQGGVTVFARDEYGNIGQATYRPPQVALRPDVVADLPGKAGSAGGCSSTGLEVLALGVLALLRRRR